MTTAEDYTALDRLLTECAHEPKDCESRSGLRYCCACWNRYAIAHRALRTAHRKENRDLLKGALADRGLRVGDRVECVCLDILGMAAETFTGIITIRSDRIMVDCGRPVPTTRGYRRFVSFNGAYWEKVA